MQIFALTSPLPPWSTSFFLWENAQHRNYRNKLPSYSKIANYRMSILTQILTPIHKGGVYTSFFISTAKAISTKTPLNNFTLLLLLKLSKLSINSNTQKTKFLLFYYSLVIWQFYLCLHLLLTLLLLILMLKIT